MLFYKKYIISHVEIYFRGKRYLPGQTCVLQARVLSELPTQLLVAHVLVRVSFPPPQVTEQAS